MYVAIEGLPALGKSETLALLRLFFPERIVVFPELVREIAEELGLDLLREREPLTEEIVRRLPLRQKAIRKALSQDLTVVEDSHLGVHAAYSASLGDVAFLEAFQKISGQMLWPDLFIRFEAPLETSLSRQAARGEPRFAVPGDVLARMLRWLEDWHMGHGHRVEVLDADRPPEEVVADLRARLGLVYRAAPGAEVMPYLILLGRPASGKSELIQFLQGLSPVVRARHYHLGRIRVLDDFPLLWEKFEEDDVWEAVGRGRLHSRRVGENYAVADDRIWPFLLLRLNRAVSRAPALPGETVILEFSRGGAQAYREALALLSREVLASGAILYLSVSLVESLRRNEARYDRDRKDSVLSHSVPREEMERTYSEDDWLQLAPAPAGYIEVQGVPVPYVTVENEPEPRAPEDFARRFKPALEKLFALWEGR